MAWGLPCHFLGETLCCVPGRSGGETDSPKRVRAGEAEREGETHTERYRDRGTERGGGRDRQTNKWRQRDTDRDGGQVEKAGGGGRGTLRRRKRLGGGREGLRGEGGRREVFLQEKEG